MKKLFIDDERFPVTNDFVIARNSADAIAYVEKFGCPNFISFDHDLGGDDTAMVFVKWLIEKDLDYQVIPSDFDYYIHSQNPIGRQNIDGLLRSYLNR